MRHTPLLTLTVLGCGLLWPAQQLLAQTPITSATVRRVVNQVGIRRGGSSWKPAQVNDPLSRGDALRTRIKSRSDVQLNDGSLARLGELSVWNFVPGTRDQVLQSGTGLFLIRPGQGPSRIKTPYGSAGIRGSALFVRVNEETQTTIVGALTNNPQGPMEITTPDGKQVLPINAGQMAIVQNNQVSVVDFDLRTFYRTSSMVEGLDLQGTSGQVNEDPAIAAVQAETIAALGTQSPLTAQDVAASPVLLSAPQPRPLQSWPAGL
ncbi:MAG: FecR domain-containing protein [Alkalinema sp. RU_4_3]|nr:FecR domain-containing protein [Alkalinema sp. RU_4_3]